jgi:hypothetical protein
VEGVASKQRVSPKTQVFTIKTVIRKCLLQVLLPTSSFNPTYLEMHLRKVQSTRKVILTLQATFRLRMRQPHQFNNLKESNLLAALSAHSEWVNWTKIKTFTKASSSLVRRNRTIKQKDSSSRWWCTWKTMQQEKSLLMGLDLFYHILISYYNN